MPGNRMLDDRTHRSPRLRLQIPWDVLRCCRSGDKVTDSIYALGMSHSSTGGCSHPSRSQHRRAPSVPPGYEGHPWEPPQLPILEGTRARWITVGGVIAAGIPVGPGLVLAAAGRSDALWFFIIAAVAAVITGTLSMGTVMYQIRQETLRMQIKYRSADTFAAAMARCIDDAHTKAQDLTEPAEIEEVNRVRISARQLLADWPPRPLC